MSVTVSSTTDSPEQIQDALAHYGEKTSEVEIIQTKATPEPQPGAEPSAPAEPEPPEAGTTAGESDTPEDHDQGVQRKPRKPKKGIEQRFSELTKARREAERQRDELKAYLEELRNELRELKQGSKPAEATQPSQPPPETKAAQPVAEQDKEPQLEDFDTYEEWVKEHQAWLVRKETAPLRSQVEILQKELERERSKQQQAELEEKRRAEIEAWEKRIAQAKAKYPDFDEAIEAADKSGVTVTGAFQQEIHNSEYGPEIAYWLAKHPDEAARIAEQTAVPENPTPQQIMAAQRAAAREVGRIEALLASGLTRTPGKPSTRLSSAPPPIRPVSTKTAGGVVDPESMTPAEYMRWRDQQRGG